MGSTLLAALLLSATRGPGPAPTQFLVKADFHTVQRNDVGLLSDQVEFKRQADGSSIGCIAQSQNLVRILRGRQRHQTGRLITTQVVQMPDGGQAIMSAARDGTFWYLLVTPRSLSQRRISLSTNLSRAKLKDGHCIPTVDNRWGGDRQLTLEDGKPMVIFLTGNGKAKEHTLIVLTAERVADGPHASD